jgi:lysine-arginine-ornithine-binding protein
MQHAAEMKPIRANKKDLEMKIILRIVTTAALLLASLLSAGITAAHAETVTLATEGAYPPFNKTEANGSFSGFEIELGNAICAKAKLNCKWVKQDFSGMMPALLAGKYDVVFSAMSITPERKKAALFSIPYLNDGFRLYGAKNNDKLDAKLSKKQIGVLTGSTGEQFVQQRFPDAVTHGYGDMDQVNADLEAGRIDYGFNAQLAVASFLKSPAGSAFGFAGPVFTDPLFGRGMGAMFRPDSTVLKSRFDDAIRAVYADGTFDKLAAKYFGTGIDVRADKMW